MGEKRKHVRKIRPRPISYLNPQPLPFPLSLFHIVSNSLVLGS